MKVFLVLSDHKHLNSMVQILYVVISIDIINIILLLNITLVTLV